MFGALTLSSTPGHVRRVLEPVPAGQKPEELAIARKFRVSVGRDYGIGLSNERVEAEPADVICDTDDGHLVLLQMTHALDLDHSWETGIPIDPQTMAQIVTERVQQKIGKRYSKPSESAF